METPYPKPISPTKTRIGWIGIGVMGGAMASRLLSAGYSLAIYARDPSKALSLISEGAILATSLRDLARSSDVVFTMVGNPQDVRSVVLESDGILSGLNPGSVLVDTTSSHPALAREIFKAARDKDCWAVDAPVSGGDIGARDGKLAIFAAGDAGVVEWLSPLFEVMGKHTYMGEAGCGQSCKIANQIVVGANLMGLSEGLVFAEKAGLDVRKWKDSVRGGAAGSMVMELFGERMIDKDFRPGGFAEYMVKDMGMGVDVVEESENERVAVLPGAALGKQMFSAMVANGDGKFGTQGLISVIERMNGNPEMLDPGRRGCACSKRLCPATPNTCPPTSLDTEAQQPFVASKVPSNSDNFAEYKKKKIKFAAPQDSTENNKNQPIPAVRKCMHCEITTTPQWRTGPLGPNTLCNACGVRYRSGRLFPEYRPKASPTFVPSLHSNSHEKVLEMRSKGGEKPAMTGIEKKIKFTAPQYSTENNKSQPTQAIRKCMHCEITMTPQWREGPLGPNTLCNACGVRYKSGRLFPEYRPKASPTFVPSLHSNSHEKVLEMRSKGGETPAMAGTEKTITNSQEMIPKNVPLHWSTFEV